MEWRAIADKVRGRPSLLVSHEAVRRVRADNTARAEARWRLGSLRLRRVMLP